jgi:CDP-diacylglycerol--glycerol-3-phosphate 3-phosphatidyltransferase
LKIHTLMDSSLDVLSACAILLILVALSMTYGIASTPSASTRIPSTDGFRDNQRKTALPLAASAIALWALSPIARAAIVLGVSANMITAVSLLAGAGAGIFLACGHFGVAALFFATASLGDALDGLVARATGTESPKGALFDASVDRYEEFFAFGGLAVFFRSSGVLLALTLLALMGSFMVSYGSAKAEALRVVVPGGIMRRAERATCLSLGTALAPLMGALSRRLQGPSWAGEVPVVLAVAIIAVSANVSAVRRLRAIAAAAVPPTSNPKIAESAPPVLQKQTRTLERTPNSR